MALVTRYRYEPLTGPTDFRLITLLPGRDSDPLSCQIMLARLDANPVYEAVSYLWGSEDHQEEIICDQTSLRITRNLASALRRFRDEKVTRILWVDSICIDQCNNSEKAQQVQRMGKIYEMAVRVLIWILDQGDELDEKALVRSLLPFCRFGRIPYSALPTPYTGRRFDEKEPQRYQTYQEQFELPARGSAEFIALNGLLRAAYFQRAWTYQECFLARDTTFYLRGCQISGTLLGGAVGGYSKILTLINDISDGVEIANCQMYFLINKASTVRRWGSDHGRFDRLLLFRRGALCKDPRDLVYSLLGITTDQIQLSVDYTKPLHMVFADTTMHICRTQSSLDFLVHVWPCKNSVNLPSWMPDWRQSYSTAGEYYGKVYSDKVPFCCTSTTKPNCFTSSDDLHLHISGYIYGSIVATCPAVGRDMPEFVKKYIWQPRSRNQTSDEQDNVDDIVYRTLCAGLNILDGDGTGRWTRSSLEVLRPKHEIPSDTERDLIQAAYDKVTEYCMYSQLFVTNIGTAGLGPEHALPGDTVTLLLGSKVPILLRKQDEGYRFIGQCYVENIMNGEAFESVESDPPIEFVLV